MQDDERRTGWILLLAAFLGLAVGVWLGASFARSALPAAPINDGVGESVRLQILHAWGPEDAMSLGGPEGETVTKSPARILLVALPEFDPRQRAFLFIRPADPALCRSFDGIELETFWHGAEAIGICAVADVQRLAELDPPVEFALRRSS